MRPTQRVPSQLGPAAYKTYQIAAPLSTHWVDATCAEVDCPQYRLGFKTTVDERAELGMAQAYFIRKESARHYTEERNEAGLTVFTFTPGQTCFNSSKHRRRTERAELFIVRGGDWREFIGSPRLHRVAANWVDDFANHQGRIADLRQRG